MNGKLTADDLTQIKSLITAINNLLPQIQRIVGLNRDIIQRYAELAEQAKGIFERLSNFEDRYDENNEGIINEINELAQAVKRLERLAILDKTGNSTSREAVKLRSDIQTDSERDYLTQELINQRKLLTQRTKTLSKQQLRAARYGGIESAPVEMQNDIESTQIDIEQTKAAIERIQLELNELEQGE